MNIPNILTVLRVLMIPVFVVLFYLGDNSQPNFYAWMIFTIACATDLIDGYLARKLNMGTKFGAFLDPVADKFIVCVSLVLIVEYYSQNNEKIIYSWIITLPSLIIICRELIISALREWMAELGKRAAVSVKWVGKWKTTFQMFAIGGLVWRQADWMIYASAALLYVAVVLTLFSMIQYLKVAWSDLTSEM